MEKTQKSSEGVKTTAKLAEDAGDKRERMDRLEGTWKLKFLMTRLGNDYFTCFICKHHSHDIGPN